MSSGTGSTETKPEARVSSVRWLSSSVTVPTPTIIFMLGLGLLLVVMTSVLIHRNETLRARLQRILAGNFAPIGSTFPPKLPGHRPDGSPFEIYLSGSAPLVLMLFDTDRAVCDQNWPQWERLINDTEVGRQCLFISTSSQISQAYIEKHPAMLHIPLLRISPVDAQSLNLNYTPQTILVERGRVIGTWPGVLSDSDMKEIRNQLLAVSANHQ